MANKDILKEQFLSGALDDKLTDIYLDTTL